MSGEWQELFAPAPVPAWLVAFDDEPGEAVDALLWGRFYFGNLQMAEPAELLIDWLDLLEDRGDFASRLDRALCEWLEAHWLEHPEVSEEILAAAWSRLLAVAAWSDDLVRTGAALRERFDEAHEFLGPLSPSPSQDPLGLFFAAVAAHQTDRTLAPIWWRLCDLPDGVPPYHARYAIAGLRGLRPEKGDPGGGFRRDVARGVVRLARSFYRLSKEGVLGAKVARQQYQTVGLLSYAAFPFAEAWTEALAQELRHLEEPIGPWLARLIPGGSPRLQRLIRERRSATGHSESQLGERHLRDWARRGRAIAESLREGDLSAVPAAERLLHQERAHAQANGDSEPLVRNFAGKVVRPRPAQAIEWADEARLWAPSNPYTWTILFRGLQQSGRSDQALAIGWETIERFPDNVVARNGLGEVLKSRGDLDQAEAIYRQTVERFPSDVVARTGLARLLNLRSGASEQSAEIEPEGTSPDTAPAESRRDSEPSMAPAGLPAFSDRDLPISEVREPAAEYGEESEPGAVTLPLTAPVRSLADAEPEQTRTTRDGVFRRGERRITLGQARLYRRLARYATAEPSTSSAAFLERAETLLERILKAFPADPRALAEKAYLLLDVGRHEEARAVLEEHFHRLAGAPDLLAALARAEREEARARQVELNEETVRRLLAPGRQLRALGAGFEPLVRLQAGRAYLALCDGQARIEGAAGAFGGLKTWVRDHLPEEREVRARKPLAFDPWLSLELRRSLLESLDVEAPLGGAQIPAIEANLERHHHWLDELEEDIGIRASAALAPVLPLRLPRAPA